MKLIYLLHFPYWIIQITVSLLCKKLLISSMIGSFNQKKSHGSLCRYVHYIFSSESLWHAKSNLNFIGSDLNKICSCEFGGNWNPSSDFKTGKNLLLEITFHHINYTDICRFILTHTKTVQNWFCHVLLFLHFYQ